MREAQKSKATTSCCSHIESNKHSHHIWLERATYNILVSSRLGFSRTYQERSQTVNHRNAYQLLTRVCSCSINDATNKETTLRDLLAWKSN